MGLVFIRLIDLDLKVDGVTVMDCDGNYNIYINSRLSYEDQQKTIDHELNHINMGHFDNYDPVEQNEREAG